MIDAAVRLFDAQQKLPLWSHLNFHAGTFECPARMHALSKDSIQANEQVIVQLHLSKAAVLLNQDKFILRNSSGDKTLGGGFVMDVSPLHHKKRTAVLIQNLQELAHTIEQGNSLCDLVKAELKKELRPFLSTEIAERLHMKADELLKEMQCHPDKVSVLSSDEYVFFIDKGFLKNYQGHSSDHLKGLSQTVSCVLRWPLTPKSWRERLTSARQSRRRLLYSCS